MKFKENKINYIINVCKNLMTIFFYLRSNLETM